MNKTWFIDIDGTIFKHRSNAQLDYFKEQNDNKPWTLEATQEVLLPSVVEFFDQIPENDRVVLVTARHQEHYNQTVIALVGYGIRYNHIIFDLASGPRILINDIKPIDAEDNILVNKEVDTAYAINVKRNGGLRHLINDDGLC